MDVCRNRPLDAAERAADEPALAAFVASLRAPPTRDEPVEPVLAHRLLMGVATDAFIVARVRAAYAGAATAPSAGYVYVFADAAEPGLLKIGRTTKWPFERLAEWRSELGLDRRSRAALDGAVQYTDDDGGPPRASARLTLLFAYPCADQVLAEAVVFALLYCERLVLRVNRRTQRELLENFAITDLAALKLLIAAVTRHVTYAVRGPAAR